MDYELDLEATVANFATVHLLEDLVVKETLNPV